MTYSITVAGVSRELTLFPVDDDLHIAAFMILGDPKLTKACAAELLKLAPEYDYMITAETKGIPLIHEMASQNGDDRYFLARKRTKVYMKDCLEASVNSITTRGVQKLYLDGVEAAALNGKKVLIIDDVVSTGESLAAIETLVEKAGGIICGRMAILAEGAAARRDDLIYLESLPLFNSKGEPLDF